MVKIFIGNLPDGGLVGNDDVRPLFEAFGTVTECEVIKNYGWGAKTNEILSPQSSHTWITQVRPHGFWICFSRGNPEPQRQAWLPWQEDEGGALLFWPTLELRTNQIGVKKVELSDNKGQSRRNTQKLFVGNIADGTTDDELRWLHQIHFILHKKFDQSLPKQGTVRALWPSCGGWCDDWQELWLRPCWRQHG